MNSETKDFQHGDDKKKDFNFYEKAKKQYQKAPKPFNYEFQLQQRNKQIKKLSIIIGRFVQIFKIGLKQKYQDQQQLQETYWDLLENYYKNDMQMKFVTNIHEKKFVKLRIFFVLSLHTKTLFTKLKDIIKNIPQLYVNPQERLINYEKEVEEINFLEDGQYIIQSSYIQGYNKFREQLIEKQLMLKKQIQEQKREERQAREREKQLILKIEADRIRKQKIQKEKQQKENKQREQKIKMAVYDYQKAQYLVENSKTKPNIAKINYKTSENYKKDQTTYQPRQINEHCKPKGMKNSQFFLRAIEEQSNIFNFRIIDKQSQNKTQCYECKKPLSEGFYILGGNINYCYYTGEWYCNDCISDERVPIPQKAKEQFDLRGYAVCKKALQQIKSLYEKAIIEIDVFKHQDNKVVKQNRKFYDFLILKRQIHLMYDSICNPILMEKLFDKKMNYFLKRNLLSLKNLKDIFNGYEGPTVQKDYNILVKHFYKCEICQSRKGYICQQCGHPPKIFAFQLRETFSCKSCAKIYHRRCMKNGKCPCEDY